jgi:hypothetical protein
MTKRGSGFLLLSLGNLSDSLKESLPRSSLLKPAMVTKQLHKGKKKDNEIRLLALAQLVTKFHQLSSQQALFQTRQCFQRYFIN